MRSLVMPRRIARIALAALFAALATWVALPVPPLRGDDPPPTSRSTVDDAIRRGIDFLVARQNEDGSWGSARRTKGLNIYAPVPGAHQGFRAADTALCISALIETGLDREDVREALDRAEAWMEENLPAVRRATPDALYNVWTHAYAIRALVKMLRRHEGDEDRGRRYRELIGGQIDRLERYESVDGGWGYYDFDVGSQKPTATTTSFTTATALIALREARDAGIDVPDRLVRRAIATLHRQQKPDFTYVYSESHKYYPMRGISRPGGSLGRSQACNLALRAWGDERITHEVLRAWLDRLVARNGWLDIGRKRPIPHESWFQVAGYFFYYGHYYAAQCMEELPEETRAPYREEIARILLGLQEKNGSWWDYPFYDYHEQYGTAYALMTLWRCRGTAARTF